MRQSFSRILITSKSYTFPPTVPTISCYDSSIRSLLKSRNWYRYRNPANTMKHHLSTRVTLINHNSSTALPHSARIIFSNRPLVINPAKQITYHKRNHSPRCVDLCGSMKMKCSALKSRETPLQLHSSFLTINILIDIRVSDTPSTINDYKLTQYMRLQGWKISKQRQTIFHTHRKSEHNDEKTIFQRKIAY